MSRKRYSPEQIINILREAVVLISQCWRTGEVCGGLDISEPSYYLYGRLSRCKGCGSERHG